MSLQTHEIKPLHVTVLTVSDTRDEKTDTGGGLIKSFCQKHQFSIVDYTIVRDEITAIQHVVKSWLSNEEIQAIFITGGTGIAKRDVTIEAMQPLFEKTIDGFGELFRYLSFTEDVGTRAMLSRAVAGTVGQKVVFVLPGSRGAIRLAMEKLIVPEIHHIHHELTKHHERS